MALKKQITLKSNFGDDVVFNDAYIKINTLNGNKNKIDFELYIFKQANELLIERKSFSFIPNLDGANFIKQGYEHLKTLPEFAGATDC
jgi:hypothetical protein